VDERSELCPAGTFDRIHGMFHGWGLLGREFLISHDGASYRVFCDEKSFLVYRINGDSGSRHHVPGWPVCMVSQDTIFEEHAHPHIGEDHCTCELKLEHWLDIIHSHSLREII
jgi:hypothetical protein